MKKYYVSIPWHATVNVEVKAKNKKQAIELASEQAFAQLCHQCEGPVEMGEANLDCAPTAEEIK